MSWLANFFNSIVNFFESLKPLPSIQGWQTLAQSSVAQINTLLQYNYDETNLVVVYGDTPYPGWTLGNTITLNKKYFRDHSNDAGLIVHETTHAVMAVPSADNTNITWWVIEGLADYVRDKLGYQTSWSQPTLGDPVAKGYQVAAAFFIWVEKTYGMQYIINLAHTLSDGKDLPPDLQLMVTLYKQQNGVQ